MNYSLIAVVGSFIFIVPQMPAQEHSHAERSGFQKLGSVSFAISCEIPSQKPFEHAIALLHSFGYLKAQAEFRDIETQDPGCAMAYWGDAMTLFRQLWDRPSKDDLHHGLVLIQKAQQVGAKTEREHGYIQTALAFYSADQNATYTSRVAAYSQALEQLHKKFPGDDEAAVFYALSLLASPDSSKNDFAYAKQAVAILNPIFIRTPDHPGVAHYLIHACDNPEMARDGLPAARRYAQIAPASAHALHMPSHIFARLGFWQDDIQSNLASKAAAEAQNLQSDRLHAMNFLEYAYLQLGDWERAKAIESEALKVGQKDFSKDMEDFYFYVQVRFPTLYLIETKTWKQATLLTPPPGSAPDFQAVIYWANAVGAGHLHDETAVAEATKKYDAALEAVKHTSYAYVADSMTTERDEVHAWSAFAHGNSAEAIQLLKTVADQQDQTGKPEVAIPAREMLADMLLELHRPQEALAQYQLSLKVDPNRFNSLRGVAAASAP